MSGSDCGCGCNGATGGCSDSNTTTYSHDHDHDHHDDSNDMFAHLANFEQQIQAEVNQRHVRS